MNELALEKVMTVKEIADILGVSTDTIKNCIRRIMPEKMQNGKTTFLNEQEVTMISKELKSNTFVSSHQTYEVSSQVKNTTIDKFSTVKELAEELHVAEQTVKNTIYELRQVVGAVFDNIERNSQGGYLLNEKQATAIKLKLRERNNLKDNSVVLQIGNDLEFFALLKKREEEQRILDAYRDRRIAELQAENERQAQQLKEQAPKVDFYNAVTSSKDCIDMAEVAKVLNVKGIGRNKLFEILREKNILDRKNQPYQKYVDNGYFRIIETSFVLPDGTQKINLKTVVFQKGLNYIRGLLEK